MLDSIYCMTIKLFWKKIFFDVQTLEFSHMRGVKRGIL